ncbi:tRNA (adenosine(37)-N6)-threonylcarbamoyltransferase complex dimerization subunit type 1 TsaB [Deinococcus sp. KNUC1210]|uniref:tRNA (adenosine(37)-N6)-threonylcarbamoyltransferase complex dimerization subunit type 1 TsaB n=1 Tax=Deinococcus sp. KNUC1210 TaxID=2917691 RepID=UPI001EF13598|nr:tRNA (adenosine(37)-N6)-threonylcarbamoyltransferase complex dimerization subunit type 1 TsaB [Deinococcus sp. KNUC1210]ULH15352.1 tRNA (adenosine(37)-N6)-threonylcarbamoyltransferase complex dimerization subunit type 1 TsaB [Deinococcus sp. KNUC1210]
MSEPLPLLSIDCGTPFLSLGLRYGEHSVQRVLEVGRAHAERLPAELDALFAEAGLPSRAGSIVVGTGPGSYTGLRVGASYALGLGRAWGVPVLGISTLEGLARGQSGAVAVSLDARKEQVYGAVYRLQDGLIVQTLHAPAKVPLADFEALAAGLPWERDTPPDPDLLARNGEAHGLETWSLSYL